MPRSMTSFSDSSLQRAKPKPRETMAKSGANVGQPASMVDRSVAQALGDYVIQTLGVAAAEVQKLYHDPLELLTRAVQPVLWLMLFGEREPFAPIPYSLRYSWAPYLQLPPTHEHLRQLPYSNPRRPSIVTRAKSFVRSAPLACATRRLSASSSSSLSPSRLRQWLRSERSCGNSCWKNSSPVKYWKYGSCTQRSHTPSSESP